MGCGRVALGLPFEAMEMSPAAHAVWRLAGRVGGVLAITVACVVVVLVGWHSPVRTAIALVFALLAPGLAMTEMLAIPDPVQRLALAAGTSLALETVVALVLVYTHSFSTRLALLILAGLTLGALVVAVLQARRRSQTAARIESDIAAERLSRAAQQTRLERNRDLA